MTGLTGSGGDMRGAYSVILTVLLCWAGCLWSGSLRYGGLVFDRDFQAFQFLPMGLLGGILVAGVIRLRAFRFYMLVLAATLAAVVFTGSDTFRSVLRDVVVTHALALAVYLGAALNLRYPRPALGKFLFWGLLCAGTYATATYILARSAGWLDYRIPLHINLVNGFLTGAGLGLGAELATLLRSRLPTPLDRPITHR